APARMASTARTVPDGDALAEPGEATVVLPGAPGSRAGRYSEAGSGPQALGAVAVVCPCLHGPYREDGTIQGLQEPAVIPSVCSGVLASADGQDKEYRPRGFTACGRPVGPYLVIR
ncbi:D-alanine--D-alanine ligase A, partial [Streptomyces sp. JV186]|nr:D-alanine--D-alanine ligase A [Streptomyces sp. JV186]